MCLGTWPRYPCEYLHVLSRISTSTSCGQCFYPLLSSSLQSQEYIISRKNHFSGIIRLGYHQRHAPTANSTSLQTHPQSQYLIRNSAFSPPNPLSFSCAQSTSAKVECHEPVPNATWSRQWAFTSQHIPRVQDREQTG